MIKEIVILTVMNKRSPIYIFLLALLVSGSLMSQPVNYMQNYESAKAKMNAGNYDLSLKGFANLLAADPANKISVYTSYYYGISAYNLDQDKKARDMFLQIVQKYSDWENINETYLWLSKLSFELDNPNQGLYYAEKVSGDASRAQLAADIKGSSLSLLNISTLESLLLVHDDEIDIANILAQKIIALPREEQNTDTLRSLIKRYNLDSAELGLNLPDDVFKDKYKVAIMLPLFTDRLWQSGVYIRKSLAVDIYEGIKLAMQELDSSRIEIVVYDTKMDSLTTQYILQSGKLRQTDAIIGPLYPKPLGLVAEYSYENQINYLNPVTTKSELIKDNPYAFLLRTGAESIGKIVADFAYDKFENKSCAIYYGPRATDSLVAYNYSERMEADSFYVAIRQKTQTDKAREIFDSLTSSFSTVDSVELRRMWKEKERVRFLPMKDSLLLNVDSLGHIFVASDNKAIASEVMSAMTSRGDTTQIIGVGNWFSTANAGLSIMEDLGVWLAIQEYENMLHPANIALSRKYMSQYHSKPGKYVYYGYYAMKFIAESLLNYGVYFQNGYQEKGNLNEWFDYSSSQENGKLVIYKLNAGIPDLVGNDINR